MDKTLKKCTGSIKKWRHKKGFQHNVETLFI